MVHRALHAYLTGQLDRARRQFAFPDLEEIGQHISETEQTAEEAEQELKTILILHLLRKQIGQELTGIVVNLTGFGASVNLPEYGVEGLIPREALGPDHWQFDEQSQCLVGRHSGAILRLAQTLRVRIVDVHPAAGQLDLAPAHPFVAKAPEQSQQQNSRRKHSQRHHRGHKGR
jgi:ribonuclease R